MEANGYLISSFTPVRVNKVTPALPFSSHSSALAVKQSKNFQRLLKKDSRERESVSEREKERLRGEMAAFAGTTQKCKACEKTVYLVDQLKADNKVYHKACFRCYHCKGTLKVVIISHFLL